MDVSFTGSRHLYGLPEHTDSFVLADTTDGEPYRLWNLDVFQFELDERMALYGGIPFVTSHTPDMTGGALWLNAAETWVDVKVWVYTVVFHRLSAHRLSALGKFSKTPQIVRSGKFL